MNPLIKKHKIRLHQESERGGKGEFNTFVA